MYGKLRSLEYTGVLEAKTRTALMEHPIYFDTSVNGFVLKLIKLIYFKISSTYRIFFFLKKKEKDHSDL